MAAALPVADKPRWSAACRPTLAILLSYDSPKPAKNLRQLATLGM